jgi:hypothetical protein
MPITGGSPKASMRGPDAMPAWIAMGLTSRTIPTQRGISRERSEQHRDPQTLWVAETTEDPRHPDLDG